MTNLIRLILFIIYGILASAFGLHFWQAGVLLIVIYGLMLTSLVDGRQS